MDGNATLRDLTQLVGDLLNMENGRVELIYNQGQLVDVYRHERFKPSLLEALSVALLERAAAAARPDS
jgi:hypothetical protein